MNVNRLNRITESEDEPQVAQPEISCYRVGQPIEFSGYADDFDNSIAAIEFSLDDGASWTSYETTGTVAEKGVNWCFAYTPESAGTYLLKARAVDGKGEASTLITNFPFVVLQ